MKGLDVLVVRLLPFLLYIIVGVNTICCYCGVDVTLSYELHGNSALYAIGFFLVSLANSRYHCIWNRTMYLFLVALPVINFVDSAFYIFPTDTAYMLTMLVLYILTAIITAFLAIRHFVQMSKRRLGHGSE
jgi:hypothetical protein